MADSVPIPDAAAANATVFTVEEQALASCSLYTMSLICIIWGGIRSTAFVTRHVKKNRLLDGGSITLSEAKKFPITASLVLFSLYLFFKPDAYEFVKTTAATYAPEKVVELAHVYAPWGPWGPGEGVEVPSSPSRLSRLLEHTPEPVVEIWNYVREYIPTITKDRLMKGLLVLLCYEGCVALAAILKPLFSLILKPIKKTPYFVSIRKGKKEMETGDIEEAKRDEIEYLVKSEFDTHDCIAIAFCLIVGISHLYKRHWITNNILGIAFSIYGIENLHLSSFKAGTLLLAGLFVYDVFWVFATDVMTSVAKGIDAPILLQFPQDLLRSGYLDAKKHSMLGLGDIVIPGIFIALLRRFDYRVADMEFKGKGKKIAKDASSRHYFVITIVAYALGLLITMLVMHFFKAAQPALLYLVPCCLFIPLTVAFFRGEVKELWNYDEDRFVDKPDDKKKKVDPSKKNN